MIFPLKSSRSARTFNHAVRQRAHARQIEARAEARKPKNPALFESIDTLRDELERDRQVNPLSMLLSFASRGVSFAFRGYINARAREIRAQLDKRSTVSIDSEAAARFGEFQPLFAGLMTVSSYERACRRKPDLHMMNLEELARRLVIIKTSLSGCDVAFIVEEAPNLYLGGSEEEVRQQIDKGLSLMRAHLPGADYYSIIERDPAILFMPELEAGCLNFRELWSAEDPKTPLDEEALALSSPKMLALAIRALSIKGLPKSI